MLLLRTYRKVAFGHGILRHEPGVAEGRQEKTDVDDDQHHSVGGATVGIRFCHTGLDHQRQEVREEDQETPLGIWDRGKEQRRR